MSRGGCTIHVTDLDYKNERQTIAIPAGGEKSAALPLSASHGWYDFSVTIDGDDRFLRRYAGRVETGKPGFSDPAMGRATS